jgi:dTDP-4-dehydrorhamnose reductase
VRLLVFGGWGQLGSDLWEAASADHQMIRPSHDEVDVTDAAAVQAVVGTVRPDAVVNAAAFHRVGECEDRPDLAFAVNSTGALNVARAAAAHGARCVFVSTDYVFDGSNPDGYREDDPVAPVNVYGVSKWAGERLVAIADPNAVIVRGSGMFGHAGSSGKGGNFVETVLSKAAGSQPISVADDQVFSPTSTRDMAERLLLLLERDAPSGVYHLANAGACSWFEFAREIFKVGGLDADLSPRRSDGDPIPRPRCSALIDTKTESLGLPPARPWQEALRSYMESRRDPDRMAASRVERG